MISVRGPDPEVGTFYPVNLGQMRAELFIDPVVPSLFEEINIVVAQEAMLDNAAVSCIFSFSLTNHYKHLIDLPV